jgi:hypothetical protein
MTEYVILKEEEDGSWRQAGVRRASSPSRALRQAAVGEGTFILVPSRSWRPLTVSVEQTTTIKIG